MLTPGEIKILLALERRDMVGPGLYINDVKVPIGISFTELLKETGLSRSVLSGYLKNLQKLGLIRRNIDTRRYYLVRENGKIALKIVHIIEKLNDLIVSRRFEPLSSYETLIDQIYETTKQIHKKVVKGGRDLSDFVSHETKEKA
ncbi:MAG: hypothetical protein DRO36_05350 [Candidatus Hecatellales archaeon]|nr:MAG: hypothetical protein DRO36_05350 [Candidatus Hecatellales archaeon]